MGDTEVDPATLHAYARGSVPQAAEKVRQTGSAASHGASTQATFPVYARDAQTGTDKVLDTTANALKDLTKLIDLLGEKVTATATNYEGAEAANVGTVDTAKV